MKNLHKKGIIVIEAVILGALVILFGVLVVRHRAETTDNVLDIYEAELDEEIARTPTA